MAKSKRSPPKKDTTTVGKKTAPSLPSPSPSKEEASVLTELLYTPISELAEGLVGMPIRKCFGPLLWQTGVITALLGNNNSTCRVDYDQDGNTDTDGAEDLPEQETLPVDEALERWIIAHAMFSLSASEHYDHEPVLFKRSPDQKPYTLSQLKDLLTYTASIHGGASITDLEASKLIGKKKTSKAVEVYGRMLPEAFDKIIRLHLGLKKEHCFLDIGHGIGNTCIQAAYTVGCDTRGLECDKGRNAVGEIITAQLKDAVDIHQKRDRMQFLPGNIKLICGDLQDYQKHRNFLCDPGITRILFDNWNGVFTGERFGTTNLENNIAAWFAMAPEGTIMCTVDPLRSAMGCLPLSAANEMRKGRKLETSNMASYYEMEEYELGTKSQVYSFSEGSESKDVIKGYKYVRTAQEGQAVFLCNNPKCTRGNNVPIPAVEIRNGTDFELEAVIGGCTCRVSDRPSRSKRKRS